MKKTTSWLVKGDINGFFGLFTNSLTNIMTALGLLVVIGMPQEIIFKKIAPALVLAVGIGNIYMAWAAKKLANKLSHEEVTALPYGVSVPHYFIVSFVVITGMINYFVTKGGMDSKEIWLLAWGVGAAWSFVQGIIMLFGAFVGPYLQKYIPKGALLGSLAGLGITYIAMAPAANVFTNPIIGLVTLGIIMIGWLANKKLPFNFPAGLLAIIVGTTLGWSLGIMEFEPLIEATSNLGVSLPQSIVRYFLEGFKYLSPFLPAAIPLGIYDFLESLDNIESAHTSGEYYNTREMLLIPAILTILSAPIGNIFPMIIYIGHPGWKATGARIGYSLMTGIGVIVLGIFGGLAIIGRIIPLVALVPILIYIATVIGKQAFASVEKKHYPALVIGIMPFIASYMIQQINTILGALNTNLEVIKDKITIPLIGYSVFGAADILVSMMLITITMNVISKKFKVAALYSFISAILSYFGFIHSTMFTFQFYIPVLTTHPFWGYLGMSILFIMAEKYDSSTNTDENVE